MSAKGVVPGPKGIHDLLLANKPEGHIHPRCEYCNEEATVADGDKTYTEDEHKAAVDAAVASAVASAVEQATAPLNAKLDRLEAGVEQSATDAAVATAVAEKDAEIAKLQSELDAAVAAKGAAEAALTELNDMLTEAAATAEEEQRIAERIDAVKALQVPGFDDDHITKSTPRWAALNDEQWADQLTEYGALAAANPVKPKPLPTGSAAFTATADPTRPAAKKSPVREVMDLGDEVKSAV